VKVESQPKEEPEDNPEDFFENRILKPLPDYTFSGEYKELAQAI